jgi:hypothetical protein
MEGDQKTFDSVELQHQGEEKVQARLASMTLDKQVAYWERRGEELRKRKTAMMEDRKAP